MTTPLHSASLIVPTDAVPSFLDALEPFAESINAFEVDLPLPNGRGRETYGEAVSRTGEGAPQTHSPPQPTPSPNFLSHSAKEIASPIRERGYSDWSTGEAVSADAQWIITAILRSDFDRNSVQMAIALAAAAANIPEPALTIEPLPDIDYLAALQHDFPPFRLGKFFLYGSHYMPQPGNGPLRLLVNAGTAFGSGEHPTTQGCLAAMQAIAKRRDIHTVIDMGCGSGILSLAAAKLWRARVTAVDIDDEAARVTIANARLNGVAKLIRAGSGNGYAAPILACAAPVDLIVCNIVARPLKRMAPLLARNLKPGGYAILSGLLDRQVPGVLAAHYAQGLRLVARHPIGEWRTLVLRK